ncbi:hypothetical protein EDEG_01442 [Edhazardia aedis USNM 41457]|uniref:ABC transporter domain-containing protein n=1 Tax=Edhazardia aedis (strain USNM 41457) TaxID=1003232 RepID=J9D935_EDHAE|nr:hypothetical protein EDEG_01442 [Edhazardia aedis USNM 41457]|eukprot:EJW04286.1 hypothetical protein EDEG_01442 [Edhazardia aedis USNM 41457]
MKAYNENLIFTELENPKVSDEIYDSRSENVSVVDMPNFTTKDSGKISFTDHISILTNVFRKYVFEDKAMRRLLIPYFFLVLLSRISEIKSIDYISSVTKKFDAKELEKNDLCHNLLLFLICTVLHLGSNEIVSFIFTAPIQRQYRLANRHAFSKFLDLDYNKFHKIGVGEIQVSVDRHAGAVSDILEVFMIEVLPIMLALVFYTFKILFSTGLVASVILVATLFCFFSLTAVITALRNRLRNHVNSCLNAQSNKIQDTLYNFETVISYNNQKIEIENYDKNLAATEKFYSQLYKTYFVLNYIQRLVFNTQIGIVFFLGIFGLCNTSLTIDTCVVYSGIMKSLSTSLYKTGSLYNKYTTAAVNYISTIKHFSNSRETRKELSKISTLAFAGVSIFHEDRKLLKNLYFEILQGEKIAIIGRNGVGKSTLLRTLLGYTKYSGKILIDNVDIKEFSVSSIRNRISYINQDTGIFNQTILYNIKYGNNKVSNNNVTEICKKISVDESFTRMKNGYLTNAGPKGCFLSGGEKQKLAFARAALKNADLLVFDEPTANLDRNAEFSIISKVLDTFASKTILVIVHNVQLFDMFDKFLFLGGDDKYEIGTYDELIARKNGFYQFVNEHNNMSPKNNSKNSSKIMNNQ